MNTQSDPVNFDQLLTVKQVAERFAVSVATIWRLAKSNDIPQPVKIGHSVRWRASDLQKRLSAQQ